MDAGYLWFSASLTRSETLRCGTLARMRCNVYWEIRVCLSLYVYTSIKYTLGP